jgi:hypothetical protein
MAIMLSVYSIYDGLMLYGLCQWFRTKSLVDWRGHHAMSAVIATSGVLAPHMLHASTREKAEYTKHPVTTASA